MSEPAHPEPGRHRVRTAVLLAAGRGSRLRPHTDTVPKPLLPWQGRPTLDHLVDGLQRAGVDRVVLVVHHLADQVRRWAAARGVAEAGALSIVCTGQFSLSGTADALQAASAELCDEPFLLSATDYLLPALFYRDFLAFHHGHDAGASVSLKRLPPDELAARSSARFDASGHDPMLGGEVLEVVEKPLPGQAPSDVGANLMFVLPPAVLPYVRAVRPSPRGEREVQGALNAWLADGGRCRGRVQPAPVEWTPGTR